LAVDPRQVPSGTSSYCPETLVGYGEDDGARTRNLRIDRPADAAREAAPGPGFGATQVAAFPSAFPQSDQIGAAPDPLAAARAMLEQAARAADPRPFLEAARALLGTPA
jgi:hypothetical protein